MTDSKPPQQRIDKWIWHARFVKTRSLAQKLVNDGNVRKDRERVSTSSTRVQPGNVLTIALHNQVKIVEILAIADKRGPFVEARELYKDLSPQSNDKTKQDAEIRASVEKHPRPGKHQRREALRLKRIYPDD